MNGVNRELWQAAAGLQSAGLLYALLDPTGHIRLATAGDITALLARPGGWQLLLRVRFPWRDPNTAYQPILHALRPEETLLVMSGDDPQIAPPVKGRAHRLGLSSIARLVAEKPDRTAKELATAPPVSILCEQDSNGPRSHAAGREAPPARLVVKAGRLVRPFAVSRAIGTGGEKPAKAGAFPGRLTLEAKDLDFLDWVPAAGALRSVNDRPGCTVVHALARPEPLGPRLFWVPETITREWRNWQTR